MSGSSSKTKVVMARLPVTVAAKVEANARRRKISVSEYIRGIVVARLGLGG